ncbi:MAG: BlaI/MecI/CopY family transcriptional regulator [Ruminococcus sp.]|nr:BlaI/MecI/CopY family transcriptional regulator [Ruminococcus sp.]
MTKISTAEWKIMSKLWEEEPRTITQLTKELFEETGWDKHTIMTYLKRLENKEVVYHVDGGRAKLYYAKIKQSEAEINEIQTFLNKAFKGKIGLMLSTMVQEEALSDADLEELTEMLKNRKGEK